MKVIIKRMALVVVAMVVLSCELAFAQDSEEFFKANCMSCHSIGGGRLSGPDLKDVTKRKDGQWLIEFMMDPQAKIKAGDAYALQIQQEAHGMIMPTIPGLNAQLAEKLLVLIEKESALERSQFAGIQISERPFVPADVAAGKSLFLGTSRLTNGGPACISCHSSISLGGLGGGRLGPDLTEVFSRQGGRKSLSTWLFAPATPTMQNLFKNHQLTDDEILSLVAFFKSESESEASTMQSAGFNFLLMGIAGAFLVLVMFNAIWRGRFKGVRRAIVRPETSGDSL